MTPFNRLVLASPTRLSMPIATYPGLHIAGGTVRQMVCDPAHQAACARSLRARYRSPFLLTAMDLSVEAEAFGSPVRLDDHEVPTVTGRLVTDADGVRALKAPRPGAGRTAVQLEAARQLAGAADGALVIGGMIGPCSLAGRLWGVSEFLELSANDPDTAAALLEIATGFLVEYAAAFKAAGCAGLVIAEPTAGLLSPRSLARNSSPYVRRIVAAVEDDRFGIVLHNCAAKAMHLSAVLESGATAFHFGAPMDLIAAAEAAGPERVVCGNLDPAGVLVNKDAAGVRAAAQELLARFGTRRNAVLSSGCDVPPNAPLANLDALVAAAA